MTHTIHLATIDQVPEIKTLLSRTWFDTYQTLLPDDVIETATSTWHHPDSLREQIESQDVYFIIAKNKDSKIVGLGTVRIMDDQTLFMNRLYVSPDHQRQGIGSQLLDHIINNFPQFNTIKLEVETENHKGYNFYQKSGFTQIATKELKLGTKSIPVVEMELKIR